jgi:chromosomal replication initiator protein
MAESKEKIDSIWDRVLSDLQNHLGESAFKVWFNHFQPISFENYVLKIEVSSKFVKSWLEQKYLHIIQRIIKNYIPDVKSVVLTISSSPIETLQNKRSILRKMRIFEHSKISVFDVNPQTNLNPRYRFDNFVVGSSNELAFAAAQAVVNKPGLIHNPLFVYGPVGVGKTHLLQATGNEIIKTYKNLKVRYTNTEQFINELINSLKNKSIDEFKHKFREVDILILDDVHFLSGKAKAQEELFHTFNFLYDLGKQIIFSSDRPPTLIPDIEERLRSRFEGGLVIDIQPPDFETRVAILRLKAQEKKVEFEDWVYELLAEKIKKNIRELEGALNLLIFKLKYIDKLTKEVVQEIVKEFSQEFYRKITHKKVIQTVVEHYGLKEGDVFKKLRKKEYVEIRGIVVYLLRELCQYSYSHIGEIFNKDHTTVLHAYQKIVEKIEKYPEFSREIEIIRSKILQNL